MSLIKLIGMKELRNRLAFYTREAIDKGVRLIVLRKNVPVLEIKAVSEKDFLMEKLANEIKEARNHTKTRKVYSQKEIMEEFGLI